MAAAIQDRDPILSFTQSVEFEVYQPEFEILSSVGLLDHEKLSSGDHRIAIGTVEGGCCQNMVFANIENGYVVSVDAEGCDHPDEDVSDEAMALFSAAMDELDLPERRPEPVGTFLASLNVGMPNPIDVAGCIKICGFGYCLTCCRTPVDGTSCSWKKAKNPAPGGPPPVVKFTKEVDFEVFRPALEVFPSVAFLDPEKLSRGKHRVEIGKIKSGCCQSLVFADVEDGIVASIQAEGCDDSGEAIADETTKLFAAAFERLDVPKRREPVPVSALISDLSLGFTIDIWGCFWICGFGYCLWCCTGDSINSGVSKCWIEVRKNSLLSGG